MRLKTMIKEVYRERTNGSIAISREAMSIAEATLSGSCSLLLPLLWSESFFMVQLSGTFEDGARVKQALLEWAARNKKIKQWWLVGGCCFQEQFIKLFLQELPVLQTSRILSFIFWRSTISVYKENSKSSFKPTVIKYILKEFYL